MKHIIRFAVFTGFYCCLVSNLLADNAVKFSPRLREQMSLSQSAGIKLSKSQSDIPVILHTHNSCLPDIQGFNLHSVSGDIVTGTLSVSALNQTEFNGSIRYIELPKKLKPVLDLSAADVNVLPVWQGDLGEIYEGNDVLIGIYDTGIDFSHPDFINENSESRILYLWDQTDQAGPEPDGFNYYGTEYTQIQINDEIGGSPTGQIRQADIHGHGTHVAGIAAGNGSRFRGMAPQAELIIVKGGDEHFDNDRIIDGLAYMFQRAGELNRPIVVNLSLGSQEGPHDGTDALEKTIDNYLWDPGRAVVIAAGNNGRDRIHAKGEWIEGQEDPIEISFNVSENPSSANDYFLFDVWSPESMKLEVTIITPQDEIIGPVSSGKKKVWPRASSRMVIVDNASEGVSPLNGDSHLWIQIRDVENIPKNVDNFPSGTWTFRFEGNPGTFHLWLYEQSDNTEGGIIEDDVDRSVLVTSPGNSRSAITVGAHISRSSRIAKTNDDIGDIAPFSSPGPTRNGLWKPELTAPGQYIVAPYSGDTETWPGDSRVTSDSLYRSWQGTSMSAPHVTGIVALMFQEDPALYASDIRLKLIQSCRKDAFTGDIWNSDWGYGKMDAERVMQNLTGISQPHSFIPENISLLENYPNPFNGRTTIHWYFAEFASFFRIRICDILGRQVYESQIMENQIQWDARTKNQENLPAGVYIVYISSDKHSLSKKMLLLP